MGSVAQWLGPADFFEHGGERRDSAVAYKTQEGARLNRYRIRPWRFYGVKYLWYQTPSGGWPMSRADAHRVSVVVLSRAMQGQHRREPGSYSESESGFGRYCLCAWTYSLRGSTPLLTQGTSRGKGDDRYVCRSDLCAPYKDRPTPKTSFVNGAAGLPGPSPEKRGRAGSWLGRQTKLFCAGSTILVLRGPDEMFSKRLPTFTDM